MNEKIVEENFEWLRGLAARRVRCREDAEDAAIDAASRGLRYTYNADRGTAKAFLGRCLFSAIADQYRKKSRGMGRATMSGADVETMVRESKCKDEAADAVIEGFYSPWESIDATLSIESAIGKLSEYDQETLRNPQSPRYARSRARARLIARYKHEEEIQEPDSLLKSESVASQVGA